MAAVLFTAGEPIVLTNDCSFAGRKMPAGTNGKIVNSPSKLGGGADCVDCHLDGQSGGPYTIGTGSIIPLSDPASSQFRLDATELPIRRTNSGALLTDLGRRVRIKLRSGETIAGMITSASSPLAESGKSSITINEKSYEQSDIAEATWLR